MKRHLVLFAALCSWCPPWACQADAAIAGIRFSLDPASPSLAGGLTPDDILAAGPVVAVPGTAFGLADGFPQAAYDVLNALSFGRDPIAGQLFFSVDRLAVGLDGSAVHAQASLNDAAGDVYEALINDGSNALHVGQQQLGLVGGLLGSPDNLAGLDLDTMAAHYVYFSVDAASFHGNRAHSILMSDQTGAFSVFADGLLHIGLVDGDEIDALALDDTFEPGVLNPGIDRALFSISDFSPTSLTFGGSYSPADVLMTDFRGLFSVAYTAAELGLRADDNVDAVDTVVPETASGAVWATGLAIGCALVLSRRFVRRRAQSTSITAERECPAGRKQSRQAPC